MLFSRHPGFSALLLALAAAVILLPANAHAQWGSHEDLYGNDGTYLGNTKKNRFDPDSVNNPYGRYGSQYSPDSVNNSYGQYGSRYSPTSPNNRYAQPGRAVPANGGMSRPYGGYSGPNRYSGW